MRVRLDLTIAEAIEIQRALQVVQHDTARTPRAARDRGVRSRAGAKVAAALGIHAETS